MRKNTAKIHCKSIRICSEWWLFIHHFPKWNEILRRFSKDGKRFIQKYSRLLLASLARLYPDSVWVLVMLFLPKFAEQKLEKYETQLPSQVLQKLKRYCCCCCCFVSSICAVVLCQVSGRKSGSSSGRKWILLNFILLLPSF